MLSDDFNVVGLFTDGREAVDAAHTLAPDVVVLDINMPGLDGFQTMRACTMPRITSPRPFDAAREAMY